MSHSVVQIVFWACGFLALLSAIQHYTRRLIIPPVCWMLLAGVAYGILRPSTSMALPALLPEPHLILFVFLPVLIFNSSRKLELNELEAVLPESGFLALAGPLLGMVVLGWPLTVLGGVPLPDALLFGAALSPTDPIAVSAVFRSFSVPERLETLLEGESLLNDGITVVLFSVLAGRAVHHTALSLTTTVASFLGSVFGALAVGAAVGAIGALLTRWWHELHNRFIGSLMPLITAYVAFALAEHTLQVSGVLSVMAATLVMGAIHIHSETPHGTPKAEEFFDDFWGFLNHLTNAVLFFMLGESMGEHAYTLPWHIIPASLGALAVFRAALVYGGSVLFACVGRHIWAARLTRRARPRRRSPLLARRPLDEVRDRPVARRRRSDRRPRPP